MLERYCDALIIGAELSGLITAAFLARRGLTVHVLDVDPYNEQQENDPFCVAHLHSKLLRSILGRLNVSDTDIQFLSQGDSPLQIIFPKKRIDVSANPILFYEELEREFPAKHEQLKGFYENLAHLKHKMDAQELYSLLLPTSFKERRLLMKFVKAHGLDNRMNALGLSLDDDHDLAHFIMSQLKLVTYTHMQSPFAFQVAELLNPNEGEIFSVQGGHHYLKKLFIERVVHHEGAYRPNVTIEKLLFKNGIFEGAKIVGQEGNFLARYVIWNTHLKQLGDYLPKMFRFRKLHKAIQKIEPSHHWFTALYEVPRFFLPPPMKQNMLLIEDPDLELRGSNYVYLQVKDKDQDTVRISASYLLEKEKLNDPIQAFDKIHATILARLGQLLPFAGEHLKLVYPLEHKPQEQDTLFPLDNDFESFAQTAQNHPIYSLTPKSFVDLFPLTYKTPAPNFYLTSPEILGSLGYEGKFMLGLKVTDLIWQDVDKQKKRAMKLERRIA